MEGRNGGNGGMEWRYQGPSWEVGGYGGETLQQEGEGLWVHPFAGEVNFGWSQCQVMS